ncbi:MAG TPA: hypothetical protein VF669_01985 [Tepidisphaeraceae bacterium]
MFRTPFACLVSCITVPTVASAALNIDVGTHALAPNLPGQLVQIFVTGNDPVEALNFNAQVADGGPELMGVINGPDITGCDIITGTIFSTKNTGALDPGSFPQLAIRSTTTSSGTVPAQGLLATLTIDTRGFSAGKYDLKLKGTLNGDTDFALVDVNVINGFIVIPEPALAGAGFMGLCATTQRRRRRAA